MTPMELLKKLFDITSTMDDFDAVALVYRETMSDKVTADHYKLLTSPLIATSFPTFGYGINIK